jgi:bifunctional non-homologous end joining protein LigD
VPKGPSLNPADKRLAMEVEDHPVSYIDFHGEIAEGNYGAGQVRIWDKGQYDLTSSSGTPEEMWEKGKLELFLKGKKLHGRFHLVRTGGDRKWLLMKSNDEFADPDWKLKQILKSEKKIKPKTLSFIV